MLVGLRKEAQMKALIILSIILVFNSTFCLAEDYYFNNLIFKTKIKHFINWKPFREANNYAINSMILKNFCTKEFYKTNEMRSNQLSAEQYPNPTKGEINFRINSLTSFMSRLTIFDSRGCIIINQEIRLNYGENNFIVNMKNYPKGVYYYSIELIDSVINGNFILIY